MANVSLEKWMILGIATAVALTVLFAYLVQKRLRGPKASSIKFWKYVSRKKSLKGLLAAFSAILFGTIFGYFPSGADATLDYAAFCFPCLAGIAAGGGLLGPEAKDKPLSDYSFIWYLGSVVLLGVAYLCYLSKAKTSAPFVAALLSMCVSTIVMLVSVGKDPVEPDEMGLFDAVAMPFVVAILSLLVAILIVAAIKGYA